MCLMMNMTRVVTMQQSIVVGGSSPEWLCELRQRKIVHDRDVNEFLGVGDDREDSGEIV